MNLLIKNGKLVFESHIEKKDILISMGKIQQIDSSIEPISSDRIIDASGCFVFPGFIDAHTHYGVGEGDNKSADDFESGTRAAIYGGITTCIDFADHLPGNPIIDGALKRIKQAKNSYIDFALHQGIYRIDATLENEIEELANFGIRIIKIFTTYKNLGLYVDPKHYKQLFQLCKKYKILPTIHAEDEDVIEEYSQQGLSHASPFLHSLLRPSLAEKVAIKNVGAIAQESQTPLYIVHVSSHDGLESLQSLRQQGCEIVGETTMHYTLLDSGYLSCNQGGLYLMTPPLRTNKDNTALIKALNSKEISVVASDHCAYLTKQKLISLDPRKIPAGIPGSQ
ncbi:MAG: hypothetical protein EOM67_12650, partial [Spirochaetia bacterium]|nr:hypothetical protein [Spirochaetia bacterium]